MFGEISCNDYNDCYNFESYFDSVALIFFIYKLHMDQYKLEYEKGSGTFSVVFTALSLKTGKYVAIKCMKKKFDTLEKVKKLK